jgi:putative inorganic carbon (hco3(-)) transporter
LAFQIYHTFLKGRLSIKRALFAGIVVATGLFLLPEEQLDRFRSAGDDATSQQRLLYWKHGIQMIKDHRLLGVGYFNFVPYYTLHHSDDLLFQTAQLPHNIFIQIGTDAGVTGLLVYLAIIWSGFRATRQIRQRLKHDTKHWLYALSLGYDAAFVGFIIAGQFVTIGYYPFMWVLLGFIVATNNIAAQATPSVDQTGARAVSRAPASEVASSPVRNPRYEPRVNRSTRPTSRSY